MKTDEQWLSNSHDYNRYTVIGIIFICNLRRIKVVERIRKDFPYHDAIKKHW